MKNVWKGMFRRRWKEEYIPECWEVQLQETAEYIRNPGQGWYKIYTYDAGVPFDIEDEKASNEEQLALVRISLERYRTERITQEGIENIRRILRFFDAAGTDLILRIAYDFEGKGMEKEPDLFSQVQDHIIQLAPLIREFENRILVFQGLFVGNWGEMHHSKFLSEKRLRDLEKAFRSGGNKSVFLALRRPVFLRMLMQAEENPYGKRTLFDDAIGASETDMGTFGMKTAGKALWKEAWAREEELDFIGKICEEAPFGGEVLMPAEGYDLTPAQTIEVFRRVHLSYLNCQYDKKRLDGWKKQFLQRNDLWDGVSLYDYIGAHMGYRFCVRNVTVTDTGGDGVKNLSVEIENTGFGNLFQEAQAEFVHIDEYQRRYCQPLDWDARKWNSKSKVTCTAKLRLRPGRWYLCLRRKWDGRQILFANKNPVYIMGGEGRG